MGLENTCIQTGYDGVHRGETIQMSAFLDEYWKNPETKLAVTDFDQTLTEKDIGIAAFEESLMQHEFWEFSPKKFRSLLLPEDPESENILSYQELVDNAARGNIKVKAEVQQNTQKLTELFSSLEQTYEILQKEPGHTIFREKFVREMLRFDEIVLDLEPFFSDFFGRQIFSRTRFFSGKSSTDAKAISQTILEAGKVLINKDIFSTFNELKTRGSVLRIITTNLYSSVRNIVGNSNLSPVFSKDDVIATKLVKINKKEEEKKSELTRYIQGPPVFGKRKVELAKQVSVQMNRKFSLAAGDSVVNDGPMIAESIKNGGVAIVVVLEGEDFEEKVAKIESKVEEEQNEKLSDEQKQRMAYLQAKQGQFVDARYLQ